MSSVFMHVFMHQVSISGAIYVGAANEIYCLPQSASAIIVRCSTGGPGRCLSSSVKAQPHVMAAEQLAECWKDEFGIRIAETMHEPMNLLNHHIRNSYMHQQFIIRSFQTQHMPTRVTPMCTNWVPLPQQSCHPPALALGGHLGRPLFFF